MKCQYCGGKTKVNETRHDLENNETYRRYKCVDCNKLSYTIEFIGDNDTIKNAIYLARINKK